MLTRTEWIAGCLAGAAASENAYYNVDDVLHTLTTPPVWDIHRAVFVVQVACDYALEATNATDDDDVWIPRAQVYDYLIDTRAALLDIA